ncbi:hypothetical protein [Mesorhizobium sp. M7A.F.Ca.US.006.01.1.1]|uniref:hypothetical protein n=1 Tax=Mesorhizobium sp. M7A.F.Ca.US.006.01.1.1 TaxID=2496707 RepID=UPI0019D2F3B0|nr:hypothetical protein [Mesorhizobium sp. M7A.F.Ca.US.006.01.1.1]
MDNKRPIAVTTAGLRGTEWREGSLPEGVTVTIHPLRTADGAAVTGYLFRRGGERTVVCSMHPRELVVANYLVPEILEGNCAVWVQGSRSPGNDLRLEHETAVLDLAAGQNFLRDVAGFQHSVLQGTSGGGPLAALYCQQAGRVPDARIKVSPGGRPTKLDTASLPGPDGVILVSAHPGQGKIMLRGIDPAVIDEADPLASDDTLSAFNPENGFRRPPESASYTSAFMTRYSMAQRDRASRIDRHARDLIERRNEARQRLKSGDRSAAVLAAYAPIFQVWRTDADLRCFDLSLDPSDRAYGSLWGANPTVANYGSVGFGRTCTPEGWLSNWSGLSSNASMEACGPEVSQPVLMIEYTGDNCVFPTDADAIYKQLGSSRKSRIRVHGNHHGQPIRDDMPNGQREAGKHIRAWLEEYRFA